MAFLTDITKTPSNKLASPTVQGGVTSYYPNIAGAFLATSSDYTITTTDGKQVINVTSTSEVIITLPDASANAGRFITIQKANEAFGYVKVGVTGINKVHGTDFLTLAHLRDYVEVYSTGSNWEIKSSQFAGQNQENLIINGNFDYWQRGAASNNNGYTSVDRWFASNQGGAVASRDRITFITNQTDVPGNPKYAYRTSLSNGGVGATAEVTNEYRIDDVDLLGNKYVTLSFWAKADGNKSISLELLQLFGSGGDPAVIGTDPTWDGDGVKKFNLTTSWQRFSHSFQVPSSSGKSIGSGNYFAIRFWMSAGVGSDARTDTLGIQTGLFDIAQVMLNEGSIAQPFKYYGGNSQTDFIGCQRYYQKSYNLEVVPGTASQSSGLASNIGWQASSIGSRHSSYHVFKVEMRRVPDVNVYPFSSSTLNQITKLTTNSAISTTTITNISPTISPETKGFDVTGSNSNGQIYVHEFHWTADAEL